MFTFNQQTHSATKAISVTPDDDNDIATDSSRGLQIGVAGNVRMTLSDMADGTYVTMTIPAGQWGYSVKRIWSTGTTATGIHALY